MSFDLKQSINNTQFNAPDIILVGGGLTLVFNTPNNPGTDWTRYSIPLNETAGWRKTTVTGVPSTQTEMLAVLSSLQKLQIRGEYRTGADRGDLDNVVLTCNPLPTATVVSGDVTICVGGSATISADLTGAAPWSITWSDGVVQSGINSSPATRIVSSASTTTFTITDVTNAYGCSNSGTGSAVITVNSPPTATVVSGDVTICAGGSAAISVDLACAAVWSLTWSDDVTETGITSSPATRVVSPVSTATYTVASVSDAYCTGTSSGSAMVTVRASSPPMIGAITVPVNPTLINTAINASADFTVECDNDDHSATWDWGDNTTSPGTVEDQSVNSVTGSHTYIAAGVYTVTLTVTDGAGNSGEGTATAFLVIYDPTAGFVVGAGWIMSPAGAYVADPSLTGKANFGFVSKYEKGQSTPDGNTTFHFNTASLKFKSTSYEWLVIAGPNAKYKGEGTINNSGNYGFMLTARDGQVSGGGGVDKFRIKIWDKNNGDAVVYDNQMNDPDDADATCAIEGGSITIHSSGASKEAAGASEPVPVSFMLEQNYPNPFNPSTVISFALPEAGKVRLQIFNEVGQLARTLVDGEMNVGRHEISWDGRNQAGVTVTSGIYFYRLVVQKPNGEVTFTETKRMAFVQ